MAGNRRSPAPPSTTHRLSRDERLLLVEEITRKLAQRLDFLMSVVQVRVHTDSPLAISNTPVTISALEAYACKAHIEAQAEAQAQAQAEAGTHNSAQNHTQDS